MLQPQTMRRKKTVLKRSGSRWRYSPKGICYLPPLDDPRDRKPIAIAYQLRETDLHLRNADCPHRDKCLHEAVEHMSGGRQPIIENMATWICSDECYYRKLGKPISAVEFLGARNAEIV